MCHKILAGLIHYLLRIYKNHMRKCVYSWTCILYQRSQLISVPLRRPSHRNKKLKLTEMALEFTVLIACTPLKLHQVQLKFFANKMSINHLSSALILSRDKCFSGPTKSRKIMECTCLLLAAQQQQQQQQNQPQRTRQQPQHHKFGVANIGDCDVQVLANRHKLSSSGHWHSFLPSLSCMLCC